MNIYYYVKRNDSLTHSLVVFSASILLALLCSALLVDTTAMIHSTCSPTPRACTGENADCNQVCIPTERQFTNPLTATRMDAMVCIDTVP